MKVVKRVICIAVLLFTSLGWYQYLNSAKSVDDAVFAALAGADGSVEKRLYEQAIEYCREAIELQPDVGHYLKMCDIYKLFYESDKEPRVYASFIRDMRAAARAYPKNPVFWSAMVELHMGAERYKEAYSAVNEARSFGVRDALIEKRYLELKYMVKLDYKTYYDFRTCLNGYISVASDPAKTQWIVINNGGSGNSGQYPFIGMLNDDGMGAYQTDEKEFRLLDRRRVSRGIMGVHDITDAGFYDEKTNYMPVKTGGVWRYMRPDGVTAPESYEAAGGFVDGTAAVRSKGRWGLTDAGGDIEWLPDVEDIKFSLRGRHIEGNVIIAREAGKYGLYDKKFQRLNGFECDDIDVCVDGGLIAFADNGLWGFVNTKGVIAVEPRYHKAASFANGYAAVADSAGLWGFINSEYDLVIDHQYEYAHYFTKDGTCLVSDGDGKYRLLGFYFG